VFVVTLRLDLTLLLWVLLQVPVVNQLVYHVIHTFCFVTF